VAGLPRSPEQSATPPGRPTFTRQPRVKAEPATVPAVEADAMAATQGRIGVCRWPQGRKIGAESTGDRPVSTAISTAALSCPIRTNPAAQAALSPKTARRESLVVVQAVAGSSPVAHLNPCKSGHSELGARSSAWAARQKARRYECQIQRPCEAAPRDCGPQILLEDPAGNPIELFQPAGA
jgi:hypothetical protein